MYHPQPINLSNIIPEVEYEGVFECYSLKLLFIIIIYLVDIHTIVSKNKLF